MAQKGAATAYSMRNRARFNGFWVWFRAAGERVQSCVRSKNLSSGLQARAKIVAYAESPFSELPQPMRRKHFIPAVALAALAALITGCAQQTSPATGRTFSSPVSAQQEAQIGSEEHPKIIAEFGGVYDEIPALNRYVDSVGQFVAATSERPDVKYTFTVLISNGVKCSSTSSP